MVLMSAERVPNRLMGRKHLDEASETPWAPERESQAQLVSLYTLSFDVQVEIAPPPLALGMGRELNGILVSFD